MVIIGITITVSICTAKLHNNRYRLLENVHSYTFMHCKPKITCSAEFNKRHHLTKQPSFRTEKGSLFVIQLSTIVRITRLTVNLLSSLLLSSSFTILHQIPEIFI